MVFTDGRRECLERTLASFDAKLHGDFDYRVMIDDSADTDYGCLLDEEFPNFTIVHHPEKQGFCGAIRSGWSWARRQPIDFVFHLEDDFELVSDIRLDDVATLLCTNPHLAQVALKRQPVNDVERAAGDLVAMWPDEFRAHDDGRRQWLTHRLWWTTNPCLYRRAILDCAWPDPPGCEATFGQQLLADGFPGHGREWIAGPDVRFAFWGRRDDLPAVHHIGDTRVGHGY
jgi:hypothetical protein